MAIELWSARESKVFMDSTEIEGVQTVDFRVNRNRSDVIAVGQTLRQGVEYGVKEVTGTIHLKSSSEPLDAKLRLDDLEQARFTLSLQLKKGQQQWNITFQECYLDSREFTMDVNGVGIAVYTFTATNVQDE